VFGDVDSAPVDGAPAEGAPTDGAPTDGAALGEGMGQIEAQEITVEEGTVGTKKEASRFAQVWAAVLMTVFGLAASALVLILAASAARALLRWAGFIG